MTTETRPFGGIDLVLDIETIGMPSQMQFELAMEEIKPDGRLKDPAKIAAHQDEQRQKWASRCGLSPATGRIACLGIMPYNEPHNVGVMLDSNEHSILAALDKVLSSYDIPVRIITFSGRGFDLPFLIVRSAAVGFVPSAPLPWRKYSAEHMDLRDILTEGSLESWEVALLGKRKDTHGTEIQALWDAGRFDEIRAHCQEDVIRTAQIWAMLKPVLEGQPPKKGM
jgi:DNA polymerase elongation subunit (family B)